MENSIFINEVEKRITKNHLLNHSFYKAWNAGELEVSTIQEYAAQYFKHVSAFPRYLSAIHTNCEKIAIRQELLENLVDEEQGDENHPELWLRFGEGMGKSRESIVQTEAMEETQELVDIFMKLTRDQKTHIGMAALYCYESMVPEIAENKIDGLKKFYGINDENTLKFFTVHLHADKWHREVIRNLMSQLCDSSVKQEEALAAIDEALYALNNFLTGMEQAHC
jgi:pyrroloquinoline-quinone synthase